MITEKIGYSYKDLTIIPSQISLVKSRSEVNITDTFQHLPLFTAPMSSVVNEKNWSLFEKEGIYSIMPRNVSIDFRLIHCKKAWSAFSLQEIKDYFIEKDFDGEDCQIKLLIDVANGHMKQLYDMTEELHKKYGSNRCLVMIGNIANPETLIDCAIHGVDYVRCGVGGGFGCFAENTKISMADGTFKKIQDVLVGDKVKTLKGEKVVLSTKAIETTKKIIINDEIECTLNHKFLVINKKDLDSITDDNLMDYAFYIEAENLNKDEHLLVKNV